MFSEARAKCALLIGMRNACPGCCAAPSARLRASSTRYGGALLIRGPSWTPYHLGPGSAVHREERCTASGTREALLHTLAIRGYPRWAEDGRTPAPSAAAHPTVPNPGSNSSAMKNEQILSQI